MLKILNGMNWLGEIGENTKEVNECLEKGLIKYWYGDKDLEPYFLALESNISAIKEILKNDYDKFRIDELPKWITMEHDGYDEIKIKNIFGDKFTINLYRISELMQDEPESYLPENKQILIYEAKTPSKKFKNVLDELGREQARIQIQELLKSINKQKFE